MLYLRKKFRIVVGGVVREKNDARSALEVRKTPRGGTDDSTCRGPEEEAALNEQPSHSQRLVVRHVLDSGEAVKLGVPRDEILRECGKVFETREGVARSRRLDADHLDAERS
jgi:hypothetical protein